jgi:hypothetical protein
MSNHDRDLPSSFSYDVESMTSDISSSQRNSSFSRETSPTASGSDATALPAVLIPTPEAARDVPPKKRKVKLLPTELALLNDSDQSRFIFGTHVDTNPKSKFYGTDIEIAKSVLLKDGSEFELSTLTIDQARRMCKNLGIVNCGSANKIGCFKAISSFFNYQQQLIASNLQPTSHSARITSSICRAINIVFSDVFLEEFSSVNDRKNRVDHENGTTNKMFWIKASDEHNRASSKLSNNNRKETIIEIDNDENGSKQNDDDDDDYGKKPSATTSDFIDDDDDDDNDDFTKIINTTNDHYILELQANREINLRNVMTFSSDVFKKKITNLFRIRQKIKERMTTSGTHDNNPWNFVEGAMRLYPGFTKISVYYFYTRCDENPGVESQFVTFLDDSLKGDSTTISSPISDDKSSGKKNRAADDNFLNTLVDQSRKMIRLMADSATDRKQLLENSARQIEDNRTNFETSERNKQNRMSFLAQVDLAKALGDKDELLALMAKAKNNES